MEKYLLITEVNHNGTCIEHAKITAPEHYPSLVAIMERKTVILLIDNFEYDFYTQGIGSDGIPFLTKVETVTTKKGKYIKTEPNDTPVDNLENLPSITPLQPGEQLLSFDALCTYIRRHF